MQSKTIFGYRVSYYLNLEIVRVPQAYSAYILAPENNTLFITVRYDAHFRNSWFLTRVAMLAR